MWETEVKIYLKLKEELKSKYPKGRFVAIMGDKILGVWEKRVDALKSGYEICLHVNFFVARI